MSKLDQTFIRPFNQEGIHRRSSLQVPEMDQAHPNVKLDPPPAAVNFGRKHLVFFRRDLLTRGWRESTRTGSFSVSAPRKVSALVSECNSFSWAC